MTDMNDLEKTGKAITCGELIERLQKMPKDTPVKIYDPERKDCYRDVYTSAYIKDTYVVELII